MEPIDRIALLGELRQDLKKIFEKDSYRIGEIQKLWASVFEDIEKLMMDIEEAAKKK